jgi:hypothetical protein
MGYAMQFIRTLFLCTIFLIVAQASAHAGTRAPNTEGEYSLLYWRYLCREHVQVEIKTASSIQLECPSQNWKVKANSRDGQVMELQEQDVPGETK